jgi:hypothetical protein
MITFRETIDSAERLNELLKSSAEVREGVNHALEYLTDFTAMLEYAHNKDFKSAREALEYIDKVLVPRLGRIRDALASRTDPHLVRLEQARDLANRLTVRLQMLADGSGELLP